MMWWMIWVIGIGMAVGSWLLEDEAAIEINKILNVISNDSLTTKQKHKFNKRSKTWKKSTKENY